MPTFEPDPQLIWGLIPRIVGVLYLFAFGSIAPQIMVAIGSRGLTPVAGMLDRIRRDSPGWRRFFEHPSLFWLSASDRSVRALPYLGLLCGLCAIYGGPIGYVGLVLGWMLWLTCEPAGLIFPWDTMVQEVGFLVLFLPLAEELPSIRASALPLPAVAFMFRWLVLRLMLGFGKLKFIGTKQGDAMYLRGFFVWMPMPSPIGWFGYHAPRWLLIGSLGFMFFGEMVAPVLGFFTGTPRLVSYVALVGLMAGIQVTGNWGYFNIGYALLCTCLLDTQSSIFDVAREPWASRALHWPDLAVNALMALMFVVSLVYFALNSWLSRTWIHWPWDMFTWNRRWLVVLLRFFRAIAPFRVINSYGVFPPRSSPPLRLTPAFEGSDDGGVTWKRYGFRYMPTFDESRPPIVAPYHPRVDQALYYAANCIHDSSFMSNGIGNGNPYLAYTRSSWLDRMGQRLLEGNPLFTGLLSHNPFPDAPPQLIRVSTFLLTPTEPRELMATGRWWKSRRLGTLLAPRGKTAWIDALALPDPEVFHFDSVDHRRRAKPLQEMVGAFASGMDADAAVIVGSDFSAAEVERFWGEFVPMLAEARGDWNKLHERVAILRQTFGEEGVWRFERLLERFAWLLRLRTERYHYADATPKIPLVSNFRYHLLLHEIILDGHDGYHAILAEPGLAAERATRTTDQTQLWTVGLTRYDTIMMHWRAFRWSEVGLRARESNPPGIIEFYDMLVGLVPPEEEYCPQPIRHPDGEFSVEGFCYPPPR